MPNLKAENWNKIAKTASKIGTITNIIIHMTTTFYRFLPTITVFNSHSDLKGKLIL